MPKTGKAERRQRKQHKRRQGMQVGSRSVFVITEQQVKRAEKVREKKQNTPGA